MALSFLTSSGFIDERMMIEDTMKSHSFPHRSPTSIFRVLLNTSCF